MFGFVCSSLIDTQCFKHCFCNWLVIFLLIQLVNKVETKIFPKKKDIRYLQLCSSCIIFETHILYSNILLYYILIECQANN